MERTGPVMDRRSFLTGAGSAAVSGLAGCSSGGDGAATGQPTGTQSDDRDTLFVDADASGGAGTRDDPMASVQAALEETGPGQTVHVLPGTYDEKLTTVRSGDPGNPITITGPDDAVLTGNYDDYGVVRIHHSHVHLDGLTVEGLLGDDPGSLDSYVDGQLIQTRPPTRTDEYLSDIRISPHRIGYSRKSLVGLERTTDAEVGGFTVSGPAGADYIVGSNEDHNGEILYIGTAPDNLGSDWHPWDEFDETGNVHIHHIDNSDGHPHAEVVDLKPGTHDIVVEYLTDRNGGYVTDDATPTAVGHNGHDNVVRWCDIGAAPILVEFDADYPDLTYGNSLYGNRLHDYGEAPIVFDDSDTVRPEDQQYLCGNTIPAVDDHPGERGCPSAVPTAAGTGHDSGGVDET